MTASLTAPLTIEFAYTRSLGPTLSRFMTALGQRRIVGVRTDDGRVHVPPPEYDPVTRAPLTEFVEVADTGEVLTWTWVAHPLEGQPLDRPFAWALIRLDGADTPLLHAVDAGSAASMRSGMRVRARWADTPVGHIRDLACFAPEEAAAAADAAPDTAAADRTAADRAAPDAARVTMVTTPIRLSYQHTASPEESRYLHALAAGRVLGQRCPACGKVYVPPRGACPTDGTPTTEDVDLPDRGTVTTFCVVNVPFAGQRVQPPYVAAHVLLDGADIPLLHLVLGCPADQVRMGMRVAAVWKPADQWSPTPENIDHFAPSGEPDAPYESYAHQL
ncbi:MAG TPA: OB-fold domain-containing protein [Kineosporiaceae bacterium]